MNKNLIIAVLLFSVCSFNSFGQSLGDGNPCDVAATVPDIDGNVYHTVSIGKQCWLKENMKATKFADGTDIVAGTSLNASTAMYYAPNGSAENAEKFGYLYNWAAAKHPASSHAGVQGPCPNGWHVPSEAEWAELETYTAGIGRYVCGEGETNIAKALAASSDWYKTQHNCAIGNNPEMNNATGFSALPAGGFNGGYSGFSSTANFWCANALSNTYAHSITFDYSESVIEHSNDDKKFGFSVRCVID